MAKFAIDQLWSDLSAEDQCYVTLALSSESWIKPLQSGFVERWRQIPIEEQYFVWSSLTCNEQSRLLAELRFEEQHQLLCDLSPIERAAVMPLLHTKILYSIFDFLTVKEQAELLFLIPDDARNIVLDKLTPSERTAILEYDYKLVPLSMEKIERPKTETQFAEMPVAFQYHLDQLPKLSIFERLMMGVISFLVEVIKALDDGQTIPQNIERRLLTLPPNVGLRLLCTLDESSRKRLFYTVDHSVTGQWLSHAPPGIRNHITSNLNYDIRVSIQSFYR